MLGGEQNYHGWILRPLLTLVDAGGIDERHLIQLAEFIGHAAPIEVDEHLAFLQIDAFDLADVPIEDILVAVIDQLDDLVAGGELGAEPGDLGLAAAVQALRTEGLSYPIRILSL